MVKCSLIKDGLDSFLIGQANHSRAWVKSLSAFFAKISGFRLKEKKESYFI